MIGLNPVHFFSHGKLLLTGEYAVLDGAAALALPTRMGQQMSVETFPLADPTEARQLFVRWESLDSEGEPWFSADFVGPGFDIAKTDDTAVAARLQGIFLAICRLNPQFLSTAPCLGITTRLDFPRLWGLGTSSTLLSNLSRWAAVDPYALLALTFGGSGYDLACATATGPIVYRRSGPTPQGSSVAFAPPFAPLLHFVYLGKKQDSREGIARYKALSPETRAELVPALTEITERICSPTLDFDMFCGLLEDHEARVSAVLELPRAKTIHFPDFPGTVKSLGAWGGDFVLVAAKWEASELRRYFSEKGFDTVFPYETIIL